MDVLGAGDGWIEDWEEAGVISAGEVKSDREMGAVGRLMGKLSVRRLVCRATAVGGRAGRDARLRTRGESNIGGEDILCDVSGAAVSLTDSVELSMVDKSDSQPLR